MYDGSVYSIFKIQINKEKLCGNYVENFKNALCMNVNCRRQKIQQQDTSAGIWADSMILMPKGNYEGIEPLFDSCFGIKWSK